MIRFLGLRKRKPNAGLGQPQPAERDGIMVERRLTPLATLNAGVGMIVAAESACQNGDWAFGGYPAQLPSL